MKLFSANTVLVLAIVGLLLVPAGAMLGTGADTPSDTLFTDGPSIVLEPHPDDDSEYVVENQEEEVTLDVTDPGVNNNASTTIDDVLQLANVGDDYEEVDVWVSHDGGEAVTLTDSATGEPIDGEEPTEENSGEDLPENAVALETGETVPIGLEIDSTAVTDDETLLTEVTYHAAFDADEETDDDSDDGSDSDESTAEDESEESDEDEPDPIVDDETGVEIEFGDATADTEYDVEPTSPEQLGEDPTDPDSPTAIVGSIDAETESDALTTDDVEIDEADEITLVEEPAELSGDQSLIGSAAGVTVDDHQMMTMVDITVPADQQDDSATVRFPVERSEFDDIDPEETSIGHKTDGGWELLESEIESIDDDEVIIEAETDGFSPFGVFADPDVEYEWTLPDGTTVSDRTLEHTFDEPGFYDVNLTVTDAFGQQDTTTYQILANDQPEAMTQVDTPEDGGETSFSADIENEMGETETTWRFPDGTERTSENVTQMLDEGEHVVELRVEDEYGGVYETEETILVGESTQLDAVSFDASLLTLMSQGIAVIVAIPVGRFLYQTAPWKHVSRVRDPEILQLEESYLNQSQKQVIIKEGAIVDPKEKLERMELVLLDSIGRPIGRKHVPANTSSQHRFVIEHLPITYPSQIEGDETYNLRVRVVTDDNRHTTKQITVNV